MKLVPLLLAGSALGGASWLGINGGQTGGPPTLDERWEIGRTRDMDGANARALVVQLQCRDGCTISVRLVELPHAR
ncbi:hypothetical protein MASR1M8_14800 [Thermomonas brevis]